MITAAYLCACGVILWCGICRLAALHHAALPVVRVAFWLLSLGGASGLFSVAAWGYAPHWQDTFMALAIALVQVATSRLWRQGVPPQYLSHSPPTNQTPN